MYVEHIMMKRKSIFVGVLCLALSARWGAFAATDNGCGDTDKNDRITAGLALCTTHAYNIGLTTNPNNDSDRQFMRDVVALKTTVMTQQMYRQYEYLDATMKRLKTQLEKAILTTKLQAAGAASSSGNGTKATTSNNRNIVLSGAYDCIAETSRVNAMNCLQRNISLVRSAIASSNMGEAKRQLLKDVAAFKAWRNQSTTYKDMEAACKDSMAASRADLESCVNYFAPAVAQEIDATNTNNNKNNKNS